MARLVAAFGSSHSIMLVAQRQDWMHGFRVIVEKRRHGETTLSEATVKLDVGGQVSLTVGEGDGPVDALNLLPTMEIT